MKKLTSRELIDQLRPILAHHRQERVDLIPILQEVQEKFGYLPREAMLETADFLQIPASAVYGVATFYNQFRFTPIGRNPTKVCLGTACHMRGGRLVLEALERELGIKVGEITPDEEFSLDRVACIGCCVMAPVAVIGEDIYPKLTPFKVEEILIEVKQKNPPETPSEE
ncbi:MAG: NADH-quinone oxidoreductase subunit NuoE [Dehalococcoidia bacterium]|nr:NADH-quinone oxidoreductase subunit NuoE [Dehalococcoidia bacterium]